MDKSWLEGIDPPTPPLTRSSTGNSTDEDPQIETLLQETSLLNLSDSSESSLAEDSSADDKSLMQEPPTFFVEEPDSYDEQAKSQFLFVEPGSSSLVLSPESDSFPSHLHNHHTHEGHGQVISLSPMASELPTGGLVASPMSATFPAGGLVASPMSATFLAGGVVASPMSATFPTFDGEGHERKSPRPGMPRKGRRKALLIGIKYYRNKNPGLKSLKGPHHDVREVQRLLTDVFGWGKDCFRVLKDDNGPARDQPTLENIKHELACLVEDARPGDHLFFYFSGHGGQVRDLDGDEDDGMDEVIVSCDGEMLVDDELHDILVKPLPAGCHLTALLDCCSSGTSLDLPFNANPAHPPSPQSTQQQQHFPAIRKHSEGNVVLLSACADAERAYEKQDHEDEHKRVRGMLTKAFIDSLKTRRKSTYDELLTSVRTQLKRKDTMQNPQLSSSRLINMDDYFDL